MQPTDKTTQASTKTRKPTQAIPVATKARRTSKNAATVQNRPPYAGLSFVKGRMGPNGWTCSDWFDVADEDYADGFMTGLKVFQELQQFIKSQGESHRMHFHVQWVLKAAFKAHDSGTAHGKNKRGAAGAFIHCAAAYLTAMMASDSGRYVAEKLVQQQATADFFRDKAAQDRVKFIERMQAARAAKRAARTATADEVAA